MDKLIKEEIIKTKRLKLSRKNLIKFYLPIFAFLVVPIMDLYFLIEAHYNNDSQGYNRIINGLDIVWLFLGIALITFGVKFWSLRFLEIETDGNIDKFNSALEITARKLNWYIERIEDGYTIAKTFPVGFGSELITIIQFENRVMINSICNPSYGLQFISWGRNDNNEQTFIRNLKAYA